MRRPLIGILPLVDIQRESYWMLPGYMRGVEEAGGLPVMLPLTANRAELEQLAASFDGFLFTGGHDVAPALYGQTPSDLYQEVCEARDNMEKILFPLVFERNKAVLGICRGTQLINAVLGGTLYQDLPALRPSAVPHHQMPPYHLPSHPVLLSGPLAQLLEADAIPVNSCHHQGIDVLAPELEAMALAEDGLVEAVYAPGKTFVWAVQWHPEFSCAVDENSKKIFRGFVLAAQGGDRA